MNFNIPPSQIVGTFTDNYDPNSYRTKYDIAMNQKFCCSNSKESYKNKLNSTSEPIERKIIFNLKIPIPDIKEINFNISQDSAEENNNIMTNVIISNTNPTRTITYYDDVSIEMKAGDNIVRFYILNAIPSQSLISVTNKNCFYISQRGNITYIDYDKCCFQG